MATERRLRDVLAGWEPEREGGWLHAKVAELYPTCRSITGDGVRRSLEALGQGLDLRLHEVPTGTQVFDWQVPREWNIRDAYIKDAAGTRVVDFQQHSLHVVNYSVPVRQRLSLAELRPHLFSRPDAPDAIPYRTSYYRDTWGFCLSHRQLSALTESEYEVCIDSTLEPGHLTYGELRLEGTSDREVLVSCHSCHPSLCNDNLSGMVVAVRLAALLGGLELRYSYRFIWIPGTIGAITWLALNEPLLPRIAHGLVLSCVGDPGPFTYKRSRRGRALIDRTVEHVLRTSGEPYSVRDFVPTGYDERQYCSPGIDLPVGCFMRTPNGEFPEYHTSGDNLALVTPAALAGSLLQLLRVVANLEADGRYLNLYPKGEPQLGRRGLYKPMGGTENTRLEQARLWMLNMSDGGATLLDIAERSGFDVPLLAEAADELAVHGLLGRLDDSGPEPTQQ